MYNNNKVKTVGVGRLVIVIDVPCIILHIFGSSQNEKLMWELENTGTMYSYKIYYVRDINIGGRKTMTFALFGILRSFQPFQAICDHTFITRQRMNKYVLRCKYFTYLLE